MYVCQVYTLMEYNVQYYFCEYFDSWEVLHFIELSGYPLLPALETWCRQHGFPEVQQLGRRNFRGLK